VGYPKGLLDASFFLSLQFQANQFVKEASGTPSRFHALSNQLGEVICGKAQS
jgi:hypothetical protein